MPARKQRSQRELAPSMLLFCEEALANKGLADVSAALGAFNFEYLRHQKAVKA